MHTIQPDKGLVARLFATMPSFTQGSGPVRLVKRGLIALFDLVLAWQERSNQRLQLRYMTDAQLKDIGIGRLEAEREAARPFWML